jgi:hypothetical protein
MENKTTTASIILMQLGGGKFKAMTGAKNFLTNGNDLSFSLPGSGGFCKNGINRVNIELTPADTYNVKFYRLRGSKLVTISEHTDIYEDGLREMFERETGLATSMGKVIFK